MYVRQLISVHYSTSLAHMFDIEARKACLFIQTAHNSSSSILAQAVKRE